MSDFLTNLVGRTSGALEVVQARVPSLYEPRRRGSGLLGARPELQARGADSETAFESNREGDANLGPAASPAAREWQWAGDGREVQLAGRAERPDPVAPSSAPRGATWAEPTAAIQLPARLGRAPEPNAPPTSRPDTLPPVLSATPNETSLVSTPPSDARRASPEAIGSLSESQAATNPLSFMARPRLASPLKSYQTSPVTPAVRRPVAPRSGRAGNPEAVRSPSSSTPDVHVSIGRVEVRALFPEPPTRRAPPPRPRPTVSLDDYLNQRNRGKR
jgi:hypothetical protein